MPSEEEFAWAAYFATLRSEAAESLVAVPANALGMQASKLSFTAQERLASSESEKGPAALELLEQSIILFLQAKMVIDRLKASAQTKTTALIVEYTMEAPQLRAMTRARELCDAQTRARAAAPVVAPPASAAAIAFPTPAVPFPAPTNPFSAPGARREQQLPLCRNRVGPSGRTCPNAVSREGAAICDACNPWSAPAGAAAAVRPAVAPPPLGAAPARLRPLHLPADLVPAFLSAASESTAAGRETCGLLLGRFAAGAGGGEEGAVTHLLLPSQTGDDSNCELDAAGELQVALVTTGGLAEEGVPGGLNVLGWIHTHPTQSAFLSAPDMHTHAGYQLLLREAVAVVVAPRDPAAGGRIVCRVLRLTDASTREDVLRAPQVLTWRPGPTAPALPWAAARSRFVDGLTVVASCAERGFHVHEAQDSITIYEDVAHVRAGGAPVAVVDVRGAGLAAEEAARRVTLGRGAGGGGAACGAPPHHNATWGCPRCTLDNAAELTKCSACETAKPTQEAAPHAHGMRGPWG